jgi:hypothetical protein
MSSGIDKDVCTVSVYVNVFVMANYYRYDLLIKDFLNCGCPRDWQLTKKSVEDWK